MSGPTSSCGPVRHLVAVVLAAGLLAACGPPGPDTLDDDGVFADAYSRQRRGIQVSGAGTVVRVLPDDTVGGRHQRFIVELGSGQTLLITHNIDIAPWVAGLRTGDTVEFSGVYEWNPQGGVVHWTHHDPRNRHESGWIRHEGTVYR